MKLPNTSIGLPKFRMSPDRGPARKNSTPFALAARVAAGMLTTATLASAATGPVANCTVGYLQGVAPTGTTIASAQVVAATETVPQYCLVQATATTTNNSVAVAVGLPTAWNDKFYWGAQGGFAGTAPVPPAIGLQRGYVSGITDTGHRGSGTDGSWALDAPDKVIDFGHRGIKKSVDVAKALVAGYYQAPIKRSILQSCSNGGRATMMHSQRYPKDFDGYIVTAPAYDWGGQVVLDFYHGSSAFFAKPGSWLPASKIKLLADSYLAACDASDGVVDGLVADPRSCKFDPRSIQCSGTSDGPSCLTRDQTDAVVRFTSDLKNKFGEVISPGWVLTGDEANAAGLAVWKTGAAPAAIDANGIPNPAGTQAAGHGFMNGTLTGIVYNSASYDWRTFDVDNDENFLAQTDGTLSALDTNLMPTVSRGAKFLVFHGWADQALNPLRTIAYWQAIVDRYGKAKADSFMRLFLVPGMQHCGGGTIATDTFDSLAEMEQWLDSGRAPDRIEAAHLQSGVVSRTRPLCAHPNVSRYKPPANATATFDINNSFYFGCADPTLQR